MLKILRTEFAQRDYTATKSSRGFIGDFVRGSYVQPSLVKISDEDALKLYRGNEWVFAVINRIVGDCIKVPAHVMAKDPGKRVGKAQSKRMEIVREFLEDPNNNKESFREIREKVVRDLLVYGRGAIEKVVTPNSRSLVEVYALMGRNVRIRPDQHGNLPDSAAYELRDPKGKDSVQFAKDELMFFVLYPTSESVYGLKPLDALANAVAADILRAAYNHNFFVNGAESNGIIALDGMSKTELKKFRQWWNSAHRGVSNSHKIAAVNFPVNFVRMAITNRDMQFTEYGTELRSKIFAVFNMQPMVMGVIDAGTGKLNSQEQMQAYKDGALKPILDKEAYVYTKEIVQEGFGFADIKIGFNEVDLADAVTQAEIDRSDASNAILTINEIRSRRSMPPVKWGDTPLVVLPGGGQVDPETGRLTTQQSNNEETGSPKEKPTSKKKKPPKKEVDKAVNILKGLFIIRLCQHKQIKQTDIDKIIREKSGTVEEEKYMEEVAAVLIDRYNTMQPEDLLKEISEIVERTKDKVTYWNCQGE